MISLRFTYLTGIKRPLFSHARLAGSWNAWAEMPMQEITGDDGCPAFTALVTFDDARAGERHRWGVRLDAPAVPNAWAINLEVPEADSQERYRETQLPEANGSREERYYFTYSRRLGAQKSYAAASHTPALKFAVWALNARRVDAVFAREDHGYIADDGAVIAATCFGTVQILRKLGLASAGPLLGATINVTAALIAMTAFVVASGNVGSLRCSRRSVLYFIGGGIAENGGVFLLLLSLGWGDVSVVIPLAGTAPLFVLGLAYLFPSERARLGWRIVAGILLVVLGVALLSR